MRPNALLRLLSTVKNQSKYPDEILIIDGSSDNKTELALSTEKFKNLKYYRVDKTERGLTKQRNKGVDLASNESEVLCFLDDDTLLEKEYFKSLLQTYEIFPNALAVGGYITNEVTWDRSDRQCKSDEFCLDGFIRKEGSRFKLRRLFGLLDNTPPGYMPPFSNGRPVSFLPPSNKIYRVEQIMGGVSSYRAYIFNKISFSTYFEGYGLYEDADFSLRLSKIGEIYLNTSAKLEHHHEAEGRPNQFKYGKMVVRNGWYVWRVKYAKPSIINRLKWNAIAWLLIFVRFTNVLNTPKRKEAFTEVMGRIFGWLSIIVNKPRLHS